MPPLRVTVCFDQETVHLVARSPSATRDEHQTILGDVPSIHFGEEIASTLNAMWKALSEASCLQEGHRDHSVTNDRLEALLTVLDDSLSRASKNRGQVLSVDSRKLRLAFLSLNTAVRTCRGIAVGCICHRDLRSRRVEIARMIQVVRDAERDLRQLIL